MTRRSFLTGLLFGLFGSRTLIRVLASSTSNGHWFPGIIHAHSTFSDSTRTATDVKKRAVSAGAKFLIETDHYEQIASSKRHSYQTDKDFGFANYRGSFQSTASLIVLPGAEIIARSGDHNTHTLALGKITQDGTLDRIQGKEGSQQNIINRLEELSLLSVAAHPSVISAGSLANNPTEPTNYTYDRGQAKNLRGIEFFNENEENTSRTLAWYLPLSAKSDVFVISGCDSHFPVEKGDNERWGRLTYVWSDGDLTEQTLLAALKAGRSIAVREEAVPVDFNHRPGFASQTVARPDFYFTVELPKKDAGKKAKLYCDGQFLGLAAPEKAGNGQRYHFHDINCPQGTHRYIIEIEECLITSPIVLEVSEHFSPRVGYGWQHRDGDGHTPVDIGLNFCDNGQLPVASGAPLASKTLRIVTDLAKKSNSGAFYAGKVYEVDGQTRCDVHAELTDKPKSDIKTRDHRTWIMVLANNQWKLWDIVDGYVNW